MFIEKKVSAIIVSGCFMNMFHNNNNGSSGSGGSGGSSGREHSVNIFMS